MDMADTLSLNRKKDFDLFFDSMKVVRKMENYQISDRENVSEKTCFVFYNGEYINIATTDRWFYSDTFQKKLKQIESEIDKGNYEEFDNADDFVNSLYE